jgi:hypothetical protein
MFAPMKRLILPLLMIFALSGCATRYYKVVTTDVNGKLISSWVAEGRVKRKQGGYHFNAVQRQVEHPPSIYRYPLGWKVRIAAARTIIYRTEKPEWIDMVTPLDVADAAEDGVSATPPLRLPPLREAEQARDR